MKFAPGPAFPYRGRGAIEKKRIVGAKDRWFNNTLRYTLKEYGYTCLHDSDLVQADSSLGGNWDRLMQKYADKQIVENNFYAFHTEDG